MQKIIQVSVKNQYGCERIYPHTFKEELYALTGRKTLEARDLRALLAMGFEFEKIHADGVTVLDSLVLADVVGGC